MPIQDSTNNDRGYLVGLDHEDKIKQVSEKLERYTQGLYYPICIGEVLADRYRVEHKLGHGSFSVVWMAHDTAIKKDVALKIVVPGELGEHEFHIQNEIIRTAQDTSSLLTYRETFFLHSPHGNHRVLVFPLQGPNIRDYRQKKPVATRISAASQLLQALKQLHDIGIVHRDLTSLNVLYSFHPPEKSNAIMKYVGRPRKIPLSPAQWKRGELVMPMQVDKNFPDSLVGDDILLGDFGVAMKAGTPIQRKLRRPAIYCAPEVLHGADPSFASDMWSYMCLFAELYCACTLFSGRKNSEVLSQTVDTLGPLPATWEGSYDADEPDDATWYDQARRAEPTSALEAKITSLRPDVSPEERELVLSILRRGLSYFPDGRLTTAQLLSDPSFKALMEMYGVSAPASNPRIED
ncbi:kinase domain-containing protein [Nemania abortiva]|nr:kinase domain-containing protein [Nemania abortiva]